MSLPKGKKIERILRVLLNDPYGKLTKYRMAKNSQTSFPWVHQYLTRLEKYGYIKNTTVKNFPAIYEIWKNQRRNIERKNFVINDPMSLLSDVQMKYALTTYQGENLVQGYLFPSRFDIYIERKDYDTWNEFLKEHGLMGPGNFRILIDDEHVFYNMLKLKEFNVVSIPQLIVDLYKEGSVCGEAADNLVNQMVKDNV